MAPLDVVLATWWFDLGGTEKSLLNHGLAFDRTRVAPRAIAIGARGRRDEALERQGIPVDHAEGDVKRLAGLLKGADVVHVGRGGLAEPLLPEACRRAGDPLLVETNVFGLRDTTPDERQFACHLFVSRMCAMRYRQQTGEPHNAFHERHRVLYNPIDVDRLRALAPATTREAKRAAGLDPDRPVAGRIGRADDRKWSPIVIAMLPRLRELVPDVQLLVVGLTPERRRQAQRLKVTDLLHEVEPTIDEERLATLYAACDVFASASSIGESFGVGLAEALTLGVPVVTSSTPHADNAQVEVVEHGRTGWLANHPRVFAEAVADLLTNDARREAFGAEGRRQADIRWAAQPLTRRLEDLYESLVRHGRAPDDWDPGARDLETFEATYLQRADEQFRPLTRRERAGVTAATAAERARWLARDLRRDPRTVAKQLLDRATG